jgi:hypothetical protein
VSDRFNARERDLEAPQQLDPPHAFGLGTPPTHVERPSDA